MIKYLGSGLDAYVAILMPLMVLFPIGFAIVALTSVISIATVFISAFCFFASVLFGYYLNLNVKTLYSWGVFDDTEVIVYTLFRRKEVIRYDDIKSAGIAVYKHAYLNDPYGIGTNVFYIFLSKGFFNERYRYQFNMWRPSSTTIKVKYKKELYNFLVEKLPTKPTLSIIKDYKEYEKYI